MCIRDSLMGCWKPEILNHPHFKIHLQGRLIPINKIEPELPSIDDYRPIVALSPMAKFLEARFALKLQAFVKDHCCSGQTGFLRGCGTFINLHRIICWASRSKRRKSSIFFVNLRKAFDSVPAATLFSILRTRNVLSPQEITFLQAWYSKIHVGISTGSKVVFVKPEKGVVQGSLLSPLLFNIFFDTLLRRLILAGFDPHSLFAYADDLAISVPNLDQLHRAILIVER